MDVSAQLVDVFDAVVVHELMEGEQSRAFRMVGADGSISVVKLLDASMADRAELDVRLVVTNGLADIDARVCRPLPTHGDLAVELTDADGHNWYVVRYEFAAGRPLNPGNAQDATSMGTALSELHSSMSRLAPVSLPLVAALRTAPRDAITAGARPHQLLHGDFNAGNLRVSDGMVRIFDFDDCGYGPPEFDVANALYMVLFDAVDPRRHQTYAVSDRLPRRLRRRSRVCAGRRVVGPIHRPARRRPRPGSTTSPTRRSASAPRRRVARRPAVVREPTLTGRHRPHGGLRSVVGVV